MEQKESELSKTYHIEMAPSLVVKVEAVNAEGSGYIDPNSYFSELMGGLKECKNKDACETQHMKHCDESADCSTPESISPAPVDKESIVETPTAGAKRYFSELADAELTTDSSEGSSEEYSDEETESSQHMYKRLCMSDSENSENEHRCSTLIERKLESLRRQKCSGKHRVLKTHGRRNAEHRLLRQLAETKSEEAEDLAQRVQALEYELQSLRQSFYFVSLAKSMQHNMYVAIQGYYSNMYAQLQTAAVAHTQLE
eukprot:comp24738_c0_seq1/m.46869 comp24738_c0_seq1/g.46869  ORF comp24738_c0_seq1/g.46869 comp24738_c0_seq1/m.46869 type:complete len:256 (-) comp24738_c0_seq1:348-1115(-)